MNYVTEKKNTKKWKRHKAILRPFHRSRAKPLIDTLHWLSGVLAGSFIVRPILFPSCHEPMTHVHCAKMLKVLLTILHTPLFSHLCIYKFVLCFFSLLFFLFYSPLHIGFCNINAFLMLPFSMQNCLSTNYRSCRLPLALSKEVLLANKLASFFCLSFFRCGGFSVRLYFKIRFIRQKPRFRWENQASA